MKDTAKGLALGLFFGVAITLAGGAAVMMLVVTPKTNAAIADAKSAQRKADDQKWSEAMSAVNSVDAATRGRALATQHTIDSTQVSPGFTVLLEPAPAKSSAALQLFDVVRPGLGTMLAKLQSAQSSQLAVKWVVDGHVKPAAVAAGASYCWLTASGEVETCQAVSQ